MQKRSNIEAKTLYYHSDGTGRDSYIGVNSGGICNQRPYTAYTTERKDLIFKDFSRRTNINIIPKTIHYGSDGTGRDNYINIDEGGLTMNGKKSFGFINELRSYRHFSGTPAHIQNDFFNDCQKILPKLETEKIKRIKKKQISSSIRLAEPRMYPDPYEGVFYRPKTPSMLRTESLQKAKRIGFY